MGNAIIKSYEKGGEVTKPKIETMPNKNPLGDKPKVETMPNRNPRGAKPEIIKAPSFRVLPKKTPTDSKEK
jgi:hypothetical protein